MSIFDDDGPFNHLPPLNCRCYTIAVDHAAPTTARERWEKRMREGRVRRFVRTMEKSTPLLSNMSDRLIDHIINERATRLDRELMEQAIRADRKEK